MTTLYYVSKLILSGNQSCQQGVTDSDSIPESIPKERRMGDWTTEKDGLLQSNGIVYDSLSSFSQGAGRGPN